MVILYMYFPQLADLFGTYTMIQRNVGKILVCDINIFRTMKQYRSYTLFHFIQTSNILSYGHAITILQCIYGFFLLIIFCQTFFFHLKELDFCIFLLKIANESQHIFVHDQCILPSQFQHFHMA